MHKYTRSIILAALAGSISLPALADYQSAVLSQSPVGYWRLNDSVTAPPAVSATNSGLLGAAFNGTFIADVTLGAAGALPAQPGSTAGSFPGYLDRTRVRIPYSTVWNANAPFSVEFWAKPSQTAGIACPAASTTFTDTTRAGWLFYQGNSGLTDGNGWYFRLYRGAAATGTANRSIFVNMAIDTNKWYHVVGVYDGTNLRLYVDGVSAAAALPLADTYRNVTDTTAPMTLGNRSDGASTVGGWFVANGKVDEAAFYAFALSDAQVAAHYAAGTNAAPATPYQTVVGSDSPSGYWRLNEIYGPSAANAAVPAQPGTYSASAIPGVAGPSSPSYSGFEAGNKAVAISSNTPGSVRLAPLNLNTNRMTLTAWIKPSGGQNPYAGIVFQWANIPALTYSGLMVGMNGGSQIGYTWNNTASTYDFNSPLNAPDDKWSFIALSVTPESATLALQDGATFTTAVNATAHGVQGFQGITHIGMDPFDPASTTFNGAIDEVAIFNRDLSVGELFTLYGAAKGNEAPQIFAQPVAPTDVYAGDTVQMSVDAGGTPNLQYQWQHEGTNVPGATTKTLSKAFNESDTGNYTVIVSNPYGNVTSLPVYVTVFAATPPSIAAQASSRTIYAGGAFNVWVSASGGGLKYYWNLNGTNVPSLTGSNYLTTASASVAGTYSITVSNRLGSQTTTPIVMTVITPTAGSYEALVLQDGARSWWRLDEPEGSPYFYDAMNRNDGTWVRPPSGSAPGVAGNAAIRCELDFRSYGDVPQTPSLNSDTFTLEYWVYTTNITSELCPVGNYVNAPTKKGYSILRTLDNTWRWVIAHTDGNNRRLVPERDAFVGRWNHVVTTVSPAGINNYVNGVREGTWSGTVWAWNNVGPFRIGTDAPGASGFDHYWDGLIDEVAYYPTVLSASNVLAHYQTALYGSATPPLVLTQPVSATVAEGETALITAEIEGSTPMYFQWTKGGVPIANATTTTLTLPAVGFSDAGSYRLSATNAVGSTNTVTVTLTVVPQPAFVNATNGLVAHLKFDGNLTDATGRGNNGTPIGSLSYPAGVIGSGSLQYSTVDTPDFVANYADMGLRPDLTFGSSVNFSLAFWTRFTGTPGDLPFFSNGDTGLSSPGYTISPSFGDGFIGWSLNDIRFEDDTTPINDGNWHSIVITFDRAGKGVTYVDGKEINAKPIVAAGSVDTSKNTVVGQGANGVYAEVGTFQIDDLGVWRRVLTPIEAYSIHKVGTTSGTSFDTYGPVAIQIRTSGSNLQIIWQAGTLLQSDTVNGTYTPVPGAAAPIYQVTPSSARKFYRVQL